MATRVGIVGASGFTGAELLRLIAGHPELDVVVATGDTQAGTAVADLYPSLASAYGDLTFARYTPGLADEQGLDLVFCGLPHGASQEIVPDLLDGSRVVVDLGADFRLKDPGLYPTWYGHEHTVPHLLQTSVYGLPELFRSQLATAKLVATPGCYVTTATLALAPLLAAGLVEPTGIVVDAASGVSGAGRPPKPTNAFNTVDENFVAYGLLDHRHTPEIEQNLTHVAGAEAQVLFTPHLAPMNRGILATCYARPTSATSTEELRQALHAAYDVEPFVEVRHEPPSTKATLGSNAVHVTAYADDRTGWVIAIAALDHRHTPEIEQNLTGVAGTDVQVLFTPHLAPMNRGILATCYARPTSATSTDELRRVLHAAYDAEPFVEVRHEPPSTKATLGSNAVHVTAYADDRTGWVVALAALDNLTKGASGGALQSANVALGLPEATGLPVAGLYP